jgi:hypothetical protein
MPGCRRVGEVAMLRKRKEKSVAETLMRDMQGNGSRKAGTV